MKIRGFEIVSSYENKGINLPKRSTEHSAGYDIEAAETVSLAAGEIKLIPTGLKAYMQTGEVLYMYSRSSNPRKKGLVLINSVGVIDKDYYNNPENEGHMFMQMRNITEHEVVVEKGERVVQGVFMPFLVADGDDDVEKGVRSGGFGSTGV
ncbi:MAG: dUTP diphosphatase [Streptococcaceae bacterium]|nr:dUTP diphosphatase [Streptococcaceae bacterium]